MPRAFQFLVQLLMYAVVRDYIDLSLGWELKLVTGFRTDAMFKRGYTWWGSSAWLVAGFAFLPDSFCLLAIVVRVAACNTTVIR